MKMFDIDGDFIPVDVKDSSYPIKSKSRSDLQGQVAQALLEAFPRQTILEDFTIPGSRLSVDFFLPLKGIVIEVQGRQHDEHIPYFHGDRALSTKFAGQISRDRKKREWSDMNGFNWIEVRKIEDLTEVINGGRNY